MPGKSNEVSRPDPPKSWREDVAGLMVEIVDLEERVEFAELAYAGLKNIDDVYHLIGLKLDSALLLLHHPDKTETKERVSMASDQAQGALLLSDSLHSENVSLDQRKEIADSEEMADIRDKFQRLVLFGGAGLFEAGDTRQTGNRRVGYALRKALLKYTGGQHQQTGERQVPDDHLARYEIPEGKEDILLSDRMVLPLSQAVHLIEEELLPAVEERLGTDPGNPDLIKQRSKLLEQAADFHTTKFFPRARPHTAERDLFTASLSGFTADGEALVTIDLHTIQSSGNTYDHLIEHIKIEIIRDCAGAGVSDALDKEIRKARSAMAGRRYSLTEVLNKLNVPELYRLLSRQFPFLRRIEDREDLKLLADLAAQRRKGDLRRLVSSMAKEDRNLLATATKNLRLP